MGGGIEFRARRWNPDLRMEKKSREKKSPFRGEREGFLEEATFEIWISLSIWTPQKLSQLRAHPSNTCMAKYKDDHFAIIFDRK